MTNRPKKRGVDVWRTDHPTKSWVSMFRDTGRVRPRASPRRKPREGVRAASTFRASAERCPRSNTTWVGLGKSGLSC